jgi:hypothetical protein
MDNSDGLDSLHAIAHRIYDAGPSSFAGEHGFSHLLTALALELQTELDAIQTRLSLLEQPQVVADLQRAFDAR